MSDKDTIHVLDETTQYRHVALCGYKWDIVNFSTHLEPILYIENIDLTSEHNCIHCMETPEFGIYLLTMYDNEG